MEKPPNAAGGISLFRRRDGGLVQMVSLPPEEPRGSLVNTADGRSFRKRTHQKNSAIWKNEVHLVISWDLASPELDVQSVG